MSFAQPETDRLNLEQRDKFADADARSSKQYARHHAFADEVRSVNSV